MTAEFHLVTHAFELEGASFQIRVIPLLIVPVLCG